MPQFINPFMLWGLLGISVPIAIHLLNRYRHKELDWAAMELLRRALVVRSRQIRIEDVLILILRCLAVMLIALAMARPTLRASAAKWLGGEPRVGVVIALDGSYSMAHQPGVASRFSQALARVQEVFKSLEPGNPVSLVVMGSTPRILLRNVGYDEARVEKAMKDLAPLPERLNLEVCLDEVARLVDEIKAPVRECYVVTDAQINSWQELSDRAKVALENIGGAANLFFLSAATSNSENLGLTRFALASGTLRRGSMARCVAEVRNYGRTLRERVTVNLYLDGTPVDQRVIDRIEPGEAQSVPLFTRFDKIGNARLSARLGRDPLLVDNDRSAVANIRDHVRVLCVDGDPSEDPYKGETGYLRTALLPKKGEAAQASLEVKTVSWLALPAQRLGDYQVVILANVPDVREEQVRALFNFVQQGGGLIVFLGDKIIPRVLNSRMQVEGRPLLPAEIGALGNPRGEGEGWAIEPLLSDHPLSEPIARLPRELVDAARIVQFFKCRLLPGGRAILGITGADAPLLAERQLGRGKVLLFTTTADRDWTDLIIHPVGPILLNQAVTHLTRQANERSFTVGEPLTVPLSRQTMDPSVIFRDPSGRETPVSVTERNGDRVAQYPQPELPGFYEIRFASGERPLVAAVNVDPAESDVRCLQGETLTAALRGLPIRALAPGDELSAAIRVSRVGRELWRELLIAALAVLALEALLAHLFSRRMVTAVPQAGVARPADLLSAPEAASGE